MTDDKAKRPQNAPNVIGPDASAKGTMRAQGDLVLDGALEGRIESNNIVHVTESGMMIGETGASAIWVDGTVDGPMHARGSIHFSPTASVESAVAAPALIIEPGAKLNCTFCITPDAKERERFMNETGSSKPKKSAEAAAPKPPATHSVRFEYPVGDEKSVALFGDFNGWDRDKPFSMQSKNGAWSVELDLEAGRYEYQFIVDGENRVDPSNDETAPNEFGGKNSVLVIK